MCIIIVGAFAAVERSIEEDRNESFIPLEPIHIMEDLEKSAWYATLQNPTRAVVEAEKLSKASHVR